MASKPTADSLPPAVAAIGQRFEDVVGELTAQHDLVAALTRENEPKTIASLKINVADALAGLKTNVTFSGDSPAAKQVVVLENKDMKRGSSGTGVEV